MSTLQPSKITLGTVQFGIPYGIANKNGQPSSLHSHKLLQFALDNGINSLDTARNYGNSEDVIGSYINADKFIIATKFKLTDAALNNKEIAFNEARESLITSLRYLKTGKIPYFLFHKNLNQDIKKVASIIPGILKRLFEEGLIDKGGLSVYEPSELSFINDWKYISAVQAPLNVLDTRMLQDDLMQLLMDNHVDLFIRSIYLQGLLLMKKNELTPQLSFSIKYLDKLNKIALSANKSINELAFSFVRDTPGVTSLVVGADTIEQLNQTIQLVSTEPLPQKIYDEIKETFKTVPEKLITPALWNL
jgi:aryl-alcohol dehydrogenase-like predicted oxidoreductase